MPDELAYLGIARFLAGAAPLPDFHNAYFYQPGYSLLVAPAYVDGETAPETTYRRVVVINGLLAGLLPLPLWFLLRRHCEPRLALAAAAVAACSPAVLVYARRALPEVAFATIFATLLVLAGRLVEDARSFPRALAVGLAAAFLPALHPRGVPVAAATAVLLVWLAVRRRLPWSRTAAALAALGVAWLALALADRQLLAIGWSGDTRHHAGAMLRKLLVAGGPLRFAWAMLGQLWYLTTASYGLFAVGVVAAVRWQRRCARAGEAAPAAELLLLLGGLAGVLFVSALHMTAGVVPEGHLLSVDSRFYGRYLEGLHPPLLALGLAAAAGAAGRRLLLGGAAAVLGTTLALAAAWRGSPLHGSLVTSSVPGLSLFIGYAGFCATLATVGGWSAAAAMVMALARRLAAWVPMAIVTPLFLVAGWRGSHLIAAASDPTRPERLDDLVAELAVHRVAYDLAVYQPYLYMYYQYLLPELRFRPFDSRRGEQPQEPVFVAARERPADDAVAVWTESGQTLWVRRGTPRPARDYRRRLYGAEPHPWMEQEGLGTAFPYQGAILAPILGRARFAIPVGGAPTPRALRLDLVSSFARPVPVTVEVDGRTVEGELRPGDAALTLALDGRSSGDRLAVAITTPESTPAGWVAVRSLAVSDSPASFAPSPPSSTLLAGRLALRVPVPLQLSCGDVQPLRLRLRNDGAAAWPGAPAGKLWLRWHRRNGEEVAATAAPLGITLLPGRELDVMLPLVPPPLPDGRYQVEASFAVDGAVANDVQPARLEVEVGDAWPGCGCARTSSPQ